MIHRAGRDGGRGGSLEGVDFRDPGEGAGAFLEDRHVLSDLLCLNP